MGAGSSAKGKYVDQSDSQPPGLVVNVTPPATGSHSGHSPRQHSKQNATDAPVRVHSKQNASDEPSRRHSKQHFPDAHEGNPEISRNPSKRLTGQLGLTGQTSEQLVRAGSKQAQLHAGSKHEPDLRMGSKLALAMADPDQLSRSGSKLAPHPDYVHAQRQGSKRTTIEDLLKDIQDNFPADEFEMTMYAALPRFRPGEEITLQDFKEKKILNGVKGHCVDHDQRLHVWTILLEDGKKMRVLPQAVQKALMKENEDNNNSTKPVEGFVAFGHDIIQVILNTDHSVGHHREVKPHVVRPKTPPKEHHVEEVVEERVEVKKKAKKKHKKTDMQEEVKVEEAEKHHFEVGDNVVMKDPVGARLGVGRVKEMGDRPGMVRVEFGQRGGVYNLEEVELKHTKEKFRGN